MNRALRDACKSSSKQTARKRLQALANNLETESPDAAESLREGLEETITLKDWRLSALLERTFSTTNTIENLNSSIRRVTRNVKRWRDGSMIQHWVAIPILQAQRGFRKLRGYKGMVELARHLRAPEQTTRIDQEANAA